MLSGMSSFLIYKYFQGHSGKNRKVEKSIDRPCSFYDHIINHCIVVIFIVLVKCREYSEEYSVYL